MYNFHNVTFIETYYFFYVWTKCHIFVAMWHYWMKFLFLVFFLRWTFALDSDVIVMYGISPNIQNLYFKNFLKKQNPFLVFETIFSSQ